MPLVPFNRRSGTSALPLATLAAALAFTACASADVDPSTSTDDLAAHDSIQRPTEHGELPLGIPVEATLSSAQSYHAFDFTLDGDARLSLRTFALRDGGNHDTVLYLYRETDSGWGRYLARDDNSGSGAWSALSTQVGAGRYRVLVRGQSRRVRGPFGLQVDCAGPGCRAYGCLFGDTYADLGARAALRLLGRDEINADTWLDANDQQQVVRAVQQSAHTDVTTAAEAFSRVDGQVINRSFLLDPAGQRLYVAYEYGAGDNSYGAIFVRRSTELVTSIHDGDLLSCTVTAERCLLGPYYFDWLQNPDYRELSRRQVHAATELSGLAADQALAAIAWSYGVSTLADGFAAIDEGELNVLTVEHRPSKTRFVAYEYGAGGNSYGAVFFADSTRFATYIQDGSFSDCAFFAPR